MFVLLFACCGMFHLAAGSGHCEKREGILESNGNNKITFDLPDLHETVIGFQLKSHGNTLISITISGPLKNNTQNFYYNYDQGKWRFIRITESEYRMPQRLSINLRTARISSAGRKFIVSSSERVYWQMFLPNNCVDASECETESSTSVQPTSQVPEHRQNTSTCICIARQSNNKYIKTIIFISVVCGLLGLLLFALICYNHHLRKRVQRAEKENRTTNSTNQQPDVTGPVASASTFGYRNSAHDSENSLYGAVLTQR
ncbi:uncharacterized protein [Palaemon carinicauda]|uniref:uncharacterized protein isoform X2 n=1 Tax=Palaemon carinicauda TaxID=392227 RepID=UPI0035B573C0